MGKDKKPTKWQSEPPKKLPSTIKKVVRESAANERKQRDKG